MPYKKPIQEEDTPFICGFRTAERISGYFDPETNFLDALNTLLDEARERFGISFPDGDWIGIKGNDFERFFMVSKMGHYASKKVKMFSETGEIELILSELDAYILLMSKVPILRPLAWLIGLPLIRPILSKTYHWNVNRRLQRSGRLQGLWIIVFMSIAHRGYRSSLLR